MQIQIAAKAVATEMQINDYLKGKIPQVFLANHIVGYFREHGETYNIRWDIAIFQSILETGWFRFENSSVKPSDNNFAGIGATDTDPKPERYNSISDGVKSQMQILAIRTGQEIPKSLMLSDRYKKYYDIVFNKAHYWNDLAGTWASDKKYWDKITKLCNEFKEATGVDILSIEETPIDDIKSLTINATDDGKPCLSGRSKSGKGLTNHYFITNGCLKKMVNELPDDLPIKVEDIIKQYIPKAPEWPQVLSENTPEPEPEPSLVLKGMPFFVGAGHSKSQAGAGGLPPDYPQEYEHNVIAAKIVKRRLEQVGAVVDYWDPNPDQLVNLGKRAAGKKAAVYIHHNAFDKDGVDEGTSDHVHPDASSECIELGKLITKKICAAIKSHNRGVRKNMFTVLKHSFLAGCEQAHLPELYFIDDYGNKSVTVKRTTRAANALADALIEYFANDSVPALPKIGYGAKGDIVEKMQTRLNLHLPDKLRTDGDFGKITLGAVKEFQHKHYLEVDGVCGPVVWKYLFERPHTKPLSGILPVAIAQLAEEFAEIDFKESDNSYNYFRKSFFKHYGTDYWHWCASAMHKLMEVAAGKEFPTTYKGRVFGNVNCWYKWAKDNGYLLNPKEDGPMKGDYVLFDWQQDNRFDHIGVFLYESGSGYVCIEGNTSDRFMHKTRSVKDIKWLIRLPNDVDELKF